ncbi:Clustered mitochondria protein [Balamuthia mandrillaris]
MSATSASNTNTESEQVALAEAPALSEEELEQKEPLSFPINIKTMRGEELPIQVSPADMVQDVRQYLLESAETCDITSYVLQLNGTVINDFVELSEVKGLERDCVIEMVPELYNKRSALLHIRRLREILGFHLYDYANTPSPSLFSYFAPSEEEEALLHPSTTANSATSTSTNSSDASSDATQQTANAATTTNSSNGQAATDASAASTATTEQQPAPQKSQQPSKKQNKKKQNKKTPGQKGGQKSAVASSTQQTTAASSAPKTDEEELADIERPSLKQFYPKPTESLPRCVQSIEFSGWNPPPGNRELMGDFFYLEVTTLEGNVYHITSSSRGFFVNGSTQKRFNPHPAAKPCRSHNLSELLSKVSASFARNLDIVLKTGQFGKHPFELLGVPIPLTPWLGPQPQPHIYDRNRSEYAVLFAEVELSGNMRDWNEEYQACKELPRSTVQERIVRDRAINKVHNDFVDCAIKGARAIVGGNVTALNAHHADKRTHMFVFNNIFFSYVLDDTYEENLNTVIAAPEEEEQGLDTDQATYTSANNDLKATKAYNNMADVEGLSTVLTAIVEFRGHRLLAQSIIPGVLRNESTKIVYGSADNGKTIHADPEFHRLMQSAAKKLHMKEHSMVDASESDGKTVSLCCPVKSKGIMGTDGRRYLVDLVRATPRDTNYLEKYEQDPKERSAPVFRMELLEAFAEHLEMQRAQKEFLEQQKAKQEAEAKKEQQGEEGEGKAQEADKEKEAEKEREPDPATIYHPNVFGTSAQLCKVAGTEESIKEEEEKVKNLGKFLLDVIIPKMIEDFVEFKTMPVDGQTLSSIMHRHGVNMRYLGLVASLTKNHPFIMGLCEQEMITRAARHEFGVLLRSVQEHNTAYAVAHFLNCLLGNVTKRSNFHTLDEGSVETEEDQDMKSFLKAHQEANGISSPSSSSSSKKGKKNKKGGSNNNNNNKETLSGSGAHINYYGADEHIFDLTTPILWQNIEKIISKKYDYSFVESSSAAKYQSPNTLEQVRSAARNIPVLRSICLKAGVQVMARDYDFKMLLPFRRGDILSLFPTVKHLDPKTMDGQQLLEAGKAFLLQARLEYAYELLNEALAIFHQVYGPMHPEVAICYGNLAIVLYHANDIEHALAHQKKMVIINERVLGLDHHDTTHSYANLALFLRDLKKEPFLQGALRCIKRAHYLGSLVCAPHHPDAVNTLTHMALMNQDLGRLELSLRLHTMALESNDYFTPEDDLSKAQICHYLAYAYSALDRFKEALHYEKKNYQILKQLVGENDLRTAESNIWLKQYTRKAVSMQIEAKKAQQELSSRLSDTKMESLRHHLPRGAAARTGGLSAAARRNLSAAASSTAAASASSSSAASSLKAPFPYSH